ncbi:MAG: hypothetical protein WD844_11775 [Thermoleophilaceae bacterium]
MDPVLAASQIEFVVDLQPSDTASWFFTVWASAAALVFVPYALIALVQRGDTLPLLLLISAVLASLVEPMLDSLGHVRFAENVPLTVYTNFGVGITVLVLTGYVLVMGVGGYVAYRLLKRGITVRGVFGLWLALVGIDLAVEYPGLLTDVYGYFGDQPFELLGFPLWWPVVNGTVMLACGFLVWLMEPRLRGAGRLLIILAAPLAVSGTYGLVAWPVFLSLNADVPSIVPWLAAMVTAALCLLAVRLVAAILAADHGEELPSWLSRREASFAEHVERS